MKILPFVIGFLMFLPAAAQADGLDLPPAGQTLVNLSATEKRTVPEDLLMASLRIEVEDATPAAVQKKINEAMTKGLALAKKESAFKVSTGAYSVYRQDQDLVVDAAKNIHKTKTVWQGSQTIDIESKDSVKLLGAVGEIQGLGFAMNNLAYTVSPEIAEQVRDELMVAALKKLVGKADVIAKTLGKAKADLIEVNVDAGGGPVMPMMKTMMARAESVSADAMPAPVAQAGETDISLTVSARALIKP